MPNSATAPSILKRLRLLRVALIGTRSVLAFRVRARGVVLSRLRFVWDEVVDLHLFDELVAPPGEGGRGLLSVHLERRSHQLEAESRRDEKQRRIAQERYNGTL